MATAREIRESNAQEALLAAFRDSNYGHLLDEYEPEPQSDGSIRIGEVEILPGQKADKPVIRDSATKRLKKGTGRAVNANDPVLVGKGTAFRQTKEYRDARERFDELFPLEGDPDERGSMAWAFEQFWLACEGSPQWVECQHPGCGKKHLVALRKDPNAMFKMIEARIGKAPQTVNINSHEEKIVKALEYRTVDVRVHGLDSGDVQARQALIGALYPLDELEVSSPEPFLIGAGEAAE